MKDLRSVLLVIRDRGARFALAARVANLGFDVCHVRGAVTALELLEERKQHFSKSQFALVICERDAIDMPAISFVDEMRDEQKFRAIPVLIVAHTLSDSDQVAAHRLGSCRVMKHHADDRVLRAGIEHLLVA